LCLKWLLLNINIVVAQPDWVQRSQASWAPSCFNAQPWSFIIGTHENHGKLFV